MNKAILVGRLGGDPDIRHSADGTPVANFSLATNKSYRDQQGNKQEQTEWHRIAAFNKQAAFCRDYLSKGRLCLIEGEIRTRKWKDREGSDRYTTEIIAYRLQPLDSRTGSEQKPGTASQQPAKQNDDLMDECPF